MGSRATCGRRASTWDDGTSGAPGRKSDLSARGVEITTLAPLLHIGKACSASKLEETRFPRRWQKAGGFWLRTGVC
jgi:hypothetical protein